MSLSKSACEVDVLVAVGIPDVFAEDGSVGELGAVAAAVFGGAAIALPIRDVGLPVALTSPPWSRVSNLFVRKLAAFVKVLMSSTACSRRPVPEPFSMSVVRFFGTNVRLN